LKVTLLSYTADAELLCGTAALTSTRSGNPSETLKQMDLETAKRILKRVVGYGHVSVIEHASFTFSIEGVSRAMTHQLVRHRMASYLQLSQRATSMNDIRFIYPSSYPEYLKNEVLINYIDLGRKLYNILIENNVPMEDARCIMPHGMETRIIMTINGRSLIHFLKLRLDEHAQWEIREVANQIWNLIKQICPTVFDEKYKEYWE